MIYVYLYALRVSEFIENQFETSRPITVHKLICVEF